MAIAVNTITLKSCLTLLPHFAAYRQILLPNPPVTMIVCGAGTGGAGAPAGDKSVSPV